MRFGALAIIGHSMQVVGVIGAMLAPDEQLEETEFIDTNNGE